MTVKAYDITLDVINGYFSDPSNLFTFNNIRLNLPGTAK